jgi:hypothetical protein
MNYVYIVQWTGDDGRSAEVFASLDDARSYATHHTKTHTGSAWIAYKPIRTSDFVTMCFGPSDPAPATITEMLASSNI